MKCVGFNWHKGSSVGKFSVKKIFLKTMMVSSKNDANNNKVSRGQMILEKMERKTGEDILSYPFCILLGVCRNISDTCFQG